MTVRPRVVVVVAYGAADLLEHCLAGLDRDERVLVVDNARSPGVRTIAERYGADVLDPGGNVGFAAGVNVALDDLAARGIAADVLLLNPDARIASAALTVMQRCFATADLAVVAPQRLHRDGTPERVLWPFPTPGRMWREALRLPVHAPDRYAIGAVLLLRAEAIVAIGRFDESYALYAEETDWQRRATAAGWRIGVAAGVVAEHLGAATSTDAGLRTALFHAAHETYVRRWFGPHGWAAYRVAALVGALLRTVGPPGPRTSSARDRARRYLHGPKRAGSLPDGTNRLRITHVVVTGAFAGTERYVALLAAAQAAAGHRVTVIGGEPAGMAAPGVLVRLAATMRAAIAELRRGGMQDVVHAHLTAADLAAAATGYWHGARLVSTRHIPSPRGRSALARAAATVLQRRVDVELAASDTVRRGTGRAARIVPLGVPVSDARPDHSSRRVLVAQRLEAEKATDVALRAWVRSGLPARGWTLVVCGAGAEQARLHDVARVLGSTVEWRGWVDDLAAEFTRCAALLAPSPVESFGLTVVEAMARGVPVVAADAGGHRETVGAVPGALLFPAGDVAGCAAVLDRLAALDTAERIEYGERLRAAQRARFDLAAHVRAVEAAYR